MAATTACLSPAQLALVLALNEELAPAVCLHAGLLPEVLDGLDAGTPAKRPGPATRPAPSPPTQPGSKTIEEFATLRVKI